MEEGAQVGDYFHATEDKQTIRDRVFGLLASHLGEMRIDSIVVEKRKTHPKVQLAEQFFPRVLGYLLRYVLPEWRLKSEGIDEVIIITDSLPQPKAQEAAIKAVLKQRLPAAVRYRIWHHPSRAWVGLQVADYCNWAVYVKWNRSEVRPYNMIRAAIRSEFDIFERGREYFY